MRQQQVLLLVSLLLATVTSAAFAAQLVDCDQWSTWAVGASSVNVRRRESCSTGQLQEQCRSLRGGPVTTCRDGDAVATTKTFSPSYWDIFRRPIGKKNFVYYSYGYSYYSPSTYIYNYSYKAWTVYCSVGCIVGAVIGGLFGLGTLVGGIIVLYCFCIRKNRRPGMVVPSTTTMVMTAPAITYPTDGVSVVSNGNQAYSGDGTNGQGHPQQYPELYPQQYPQQYPQLYPQHLQQFPRQHLQQLQLQQQQQPGVLSPPHPPNDLPPQGIHSTTYPLMSA